MKMSDQYIKAHNIISKLIKDRIEQVGDRG